MNVFKTLNRFEMPMANSYTSHLDCRQKCYFPGGICNEANLQCTHTHTHKEGKKGRDCVKRAAVAGDGKAF